MRGPRVLFFFLLIVNFGLHSQNMADYTDSWEGKIENAKAFSLTVEIENVGTDTARLRISNGTRDEKYPITSSEQMQVNGRIGERLFFEGMLSETGNQINGFIRSGMLFYHVTLTKSQTNSFIGTWNILMVDSLKSPHFYLSIENGLENGLENDFQAYPIFGDNRFTGTWCDNFQKENDRISFTDFKTGMEFSGKLGQDHIELHVFAAGLLVTELVLRRSQSDWEIGGISSENKLSKLKLPEMESLISNHSFVNTHAVLMAKKGELIYEKYFEGYEANQPHDMRSSSKSISSAFVGIAKDNSLFRRVNQSIFEFLPKEYQIFSDSLRSKIDLQSLLTMSSGLDAIDYGINANPSSPAVEDNYQRTQDWTAAILTAPMINDPNTHANYGSANPYLLGVAVDSMVEGPLELFMDQELFQKLDISNYVIQSDRRDRPYFGGGMYLTPRDMLKFGELYLNKGKWGKERVLSKRWIKESFKNYHVLENTQDKNGYGYLWWHGAYKIGNTTIKTLEARGAGGQYIFVVPSLKVVAVITSGNFRNGKTEQPETIFRSCILPFL